MDTNFETLSSVIADLMRTKGISIEKLSHTTGISERHIELLVEGRIDKLPASPYLHGYILKIGEVLGFEGEELWSTYAERNTDIRRSGEKDILPRNRFKTSAISKKHISIGVVVLFVIIYVAFRLPYIVGKPELSIENIPDNLIVDTNIFVLRGTINPHDQLTINNEIVYPNSDGSFELPLQLTSGFNTFEITTKQSLGGATTITKQIFYQVPDAVTTGTTPTL